MWHGRDTLAKATLGYQVGFDGGKRAALRDAAKPVVL